MRVPERLSVKVQPSYGGVTGVSGDASAMGQLPRAAACVQWSGLVPTRQALCVGDDKGGLAQTL